MKDKVFKIITISVVVVIAACCLFPFLHVLAVSFSDKTAVIRGEVLLWPQSFKLSAYKAVFNNKGLMDSMWFTLILTVVLYRVQSDYDDFMCLSAFIPRPEIKVAYLALHTVYHVFQRRHDPRLPEHQVARAVGYLLGAGVSDHAVHL